MNRNYQKELDKLIDSLGTKTPTLLLHSCCAPCSSYVLEYLRSAFLITVLYYNPNITEPEEYQKRVSEQRRLIETMNREMPENPIQTAETDYEPEAFLELAKGLEQCPEGGERCFGCYALRLQKTAELAAQKGFDYFATTLTISPLKNAEKLNEIGEKIGMQQGICYLSSDFKKKNGYQRSVELSKKYDLYRQDYCGCIYSKKG